MEQRKVVAFRDLKARGVNYCRLYVMTMVRKGRFPQPLALGNRCVRWYADEIDEWAKQEAERQKVMQKWAAGANWTAPASPTTESEPLARTRLNRKETP